MKKNTMSRAIEILRKEGIRSFSKKASAYIANYVADYVGRRLESFALPYALLRIKGLNRGCSLDELLDFAFNDCAGLVRPGQVQSEVSELLKIVNETKAKVILEIGTADGGTLFLFSHTAAEGATMISIDLPGGRFGGGYPAWRTLLYKSFALPGQRMCLLRADSHKRDTLEQVKAILDGREIDFLFIDGDHTYEGVKMDFEMYSPLVKRAGIVAFHDIVPHPSETGCEVSKLWKEVKLRYSHLELVKDQSQNWAGIGVIYV
jgi:predicted O-methyltransferase YrrM